MLYPNYGVFALAEDGGEPRRVSSSISARVSADGRTLVEAEHNSVTLRDLSRPNEDYLPVVARTGRFPVLGMAKTGQAVFGRPGELVVLTDAYTIAGITIDEIPPA